MSTRPYGKKIKIGKGVKGDTRAARAEVSAYLEQERRDKEALWQRARNEIQNNDPRLFDLALDRIREDPFWWFQNFVYTYDSPDDKTRIKKFPAEKDYFKIILDVIQRDKIVYIVKTRQMLASWFISGLGLWKTQFFPYSEGYVQCNNEDTVDYFVGGRIKCIYDQLPDWQKTPPATFKYLKMYNQDSGSFMSGIPSGSDKARGRVPSLFLGDELASQETGQDSIMSVLPSIHGDAWFLGVSTPKGKNFFYKLCHPRKKKHLETIHPIPESPKTRIERYEGCTVIFLHYTADPEKRSKEWYEAERAKFFASGKGEEAWQQEYELSFDYTSNPRLFPKFDPIIHSKELVFNPYLPIVRGWDFGYQRPAIAFMQENKLNQLELLWGIIGGDWDIHDFIGHVLKYCKENFKPVLHDGKLLPIRYEDFCDHQGEQQHDIGQRKKILRQYSIYARSRFSKPEKRAELIADRLKQRKDDKPGLLVNRNCAVLMEGFSGGFACKPDGIGDPTGIPDSKSMYVHLLDAIGYAIDNKWGTYRAPLEDEEYRRIKRARQRHERRYNKVTGYSYSY